MLNKIKGIILYSKLSNDNNLYIKFLSENDEVISGIVFGGSSSKNKNIYQLGFFLNFVIEKKKSNFPYSIKGEVIAPYLSPLIDDKFKLHCLLAIISLINLSLIEGQKIQNIFKISGKMINSLILKKNWLIYFIKYLYNLLKIIGYEIDYINNSKKPYFDISLVKFRNIKNDFSLLFPHQLLNNEIKINYESVKSAFMIFDSIFQNNHLINMNLKLPIHYIKFKNLILQYLRDKL